MSTTNKYFVEGVTYNNMQEKDWLLLAGAEETNET